MHPLGWRRSRTGLLVPVYPVAGGAPGYPQVASVALDSEDSVTTTHVFDAPTGIASGNLLVGLIAFTGTPGTTFTGWTQRAGYSTVGGALRCRVYERIADGTEGSTFTLTTSSSQRSCAHIYRITNWHGSAAVEVSAGVISDSATDPNPDTLTPSWGSLETLWIAMGVKSVAPATFNGYPANYTNGQYRDATSSLTLVTARRELTAASEDPGVFDFTGASAVIALTVGIRPAAVQEFFGGGQRHGHGFGVVVG